jgi:hypothetical protein
MVAPRKVIMRRPYVNLGEEVKRVAMTVPHWSFCHSDRHFWNECRLLGSLDARNCFLLGNLDANLGWDRRFLVETSNTHKEWIANFLISRD